MSMDTRKGGLAPNPKSDLKENNPEIPDSRKRSVVSQVTILSDDESESLETVNLSQPSLSSDNKEGFSPVKPNNNARSINDMSSEPVESDLTIVTVNISPS